MSSNKRYWVWWRRRERKSVTFLKLKLVRYCSFFLWFFSFSFPLPHQHETCISTHDRFPMRFPFHYKMYHIAALSAAAVPPIFRLDPTKYSPSSPSWLWWRPDPCRCSPQRTPWAKGTRKSNMSSSRRRWPLHMTRVVSSAEIECFVLLRSGVRWRLREDCVLITFLMEW